MKHFNIFIYAKLNFQEHKEVNGRQEKMVSEYQKGYQATPPASKTRLTSNSNKAE